MRLKKLLFKITYLHIINNINKNKKVLSPAQSGFISAIFEKTD